MSSGSRCNGGLRYVHCWCGEKMKVLLTTLAVANLVCEEDGDVFASRWSCGGRLRCCNSVVVMVLALFLDAELIGRRTRGGRSCKVCGGALLQLQTEMVVHRGARSVNGAAAAWCSGTSFHGGAAHFGSQVRWLRVETEDITGADLRFPAR
ncbi:hypothetical protein DEO72_LG5g1510 [Vigna unguiculata]|uniref:Uncharacterized protein n=1 Tax=Vigna unguiculata TaxID=3917 RepID=A0A4D6LXJ8_VIGUN|nr:hypothetical protein DEO72_LG5g1510 [Vigna unguiculata]